MSRDFEGAMSAAMAEETSSEGESSRPVETHTEGDCRPPSTEVACEKRETRSGRWLSVSNRADDESSSEQLGEDAVDDDGEDAAVVAVMPSP